jgi:CRP-like cAMP-binding protein/Fe-S-cluster-containing hydrogenase component 2
LWGWLGQITTTIAGREGQQGAIRVDGSSPLGYGKPVAERTAEDVILGEMTCMSHYPRSATVVAMDEAEVLEIRRNVLYMLQRNPTSREILDNVYRERALGSHLQGVALFAALPEQERQECIAYLRDKVELVHVDPGQLIFQQGEPADHFYMIRLGFVKVSRSYAGQERVLNYLGPGAHFGEIGMLSQLSDLLAGRVPAGFRGLRTATCSALDDAELVRIRGDYFRELCQRHPAFREKLSQHAVELLKRDEALSETLGRPLGEFLEQGLFNAQKLLVLDLESCTRCDECTKACADTHQGVTRLVREGLRFDKFLVASSCRSCLDPYCLVGCPVDAIHREQSMEIAIEDHCIGCGLCAKNCPYGNINMHGFEEMRDDPAQSGRRQAVIQQKATTCDLCRHVVGPDEDPSCVYACPHNAAFRMSGTELMERVAQRR